MASHLSCALSPIQATVDITFDEDLSCGNLVDGVTVLADGVTIDLGGFTLTGTSGASGINNSLGFDDVTIKNGVIENFSLNGVNIKHGERNHVMHMTIRDGNSSGVYGREAHGLIVSDTTTSNHGQGIFLQATHDALLSRNRASDNLFAGILMQPAGQLKNMNVRLLRNNASGNLRPGFVLEGSHLTIARNTANDNGPGPENHLVPGFHLVDVDESLVRRNVARGNSLDGFLVHANSESNDLIRNTATGNAQDGIQLAGAQNTLWRNFVRQNGEDGIDDTGLANTIGKNRAFKNGGHGIRGNPAGSIDGGGNIAFLNALSQCTAPIMCLP